ncbi:MULTISPECIES: phage tail protein [unclassified Brevundimonas]|uniref:phage tail protein n=1 Tax=unclassified Brevundimonas TaxID=2622653 RepID=UPI000CFDFA96|nr:MULTISPECIES: tail fiber protein [unclassified Brevundimonas]PRA33562.1 phage tail protein [Brevundimonas sp. MYb27]PQZ81778.1 phage tail protein [Brevundimonas sp. MYb31]PRB13371.1 phage tail protein [Brevundimonas sp. MYb52]PRB34020.1 phage tail protein [Brevundimonas sp. MYb46]PRB52708.1 phage tail protein [Brevundimonas sp. MYb33]
MSTPYVGEIRMFGFPRIPVGWLACNGGLVSIADNEVLYTLLGTAYGGDGVNTFGLPDLRGQVPIHHGTGPGLSAKVLGQRGGSENVTLLQSNLPPHTHAFSATSAAATTDTPGQTALHAAQSADTAYMATSPNITLGPASISNSGNGLSHNNIMPTLAVSYCIAAFGIFPSRN